MIIVTLVYLPASAQASVISDYFSSAGLEITVVPSSPLYYLKTLWENVQLFLSTPNSEIRAQLLLTFCNARLQEIYHEISQENQLTPGEELFTVIKRYQEHFSELEQITQNVTVGSTKLSDLLERHSANRDQLKEFLKTRSENLGEFWTNEISTVIFGPASNNNSLSYKATNPSTVLGTYEMQGLELYPLQNNVLP
ncbi:hypothetical protein KJ596_03905 [Patescibacteria group bacterium]|nr:hypothetical protein [Patescibacteria group bacterium]MBU1868071.1 hypothetical protein [Patescibacteria group bacterium]